jgi:hypothetical protein
MVRDTTHETEIVSQPTASASIMLPASVESPEDENLRSLFRLDDGRLRLDETQLKGKGPLNSAKRLAYLRLLYAHRFEENRPVEREEILSLIQDAKWYNTSTSARVFNDNNDFDAVGSAFVLRGTGRRKAQELLKDVFNEAVPQPNFEVSSSGRGGKKSGSGGEKQAEGEKKTLRAGTKLQRAADWVPEWKKLNLLPEGKAHDILKGRPLTDRGIFGLWAIRRALGNAAVPPTAYSLSAFLFQAFEIEANRLALTRTLVSDATKGKVTLVDSTKLHILPDGVRYAEQMAGLAAKEDA